ncbi:MAG: hypothetical protein ACRCYM_03205 [Cetobacterium sp.]
MNKRFTYAVFTKRFLFLSFIFFGIWEFSQSFFYENEGLSISNLVYNRLHCTIGDIMILSSVLLIWSFIKYNFSWIQNPKLADYLGVTFLGILYTVFSEIHNVKILKSWSYSNLMPIIPIIDVGIVPIIQWLILPTLIIYLSKKI